MKLNAIKFLFKQRIHGGKKHCLPQKYKQIKELLFITEQQY